MRFNKGIAAAVLAPFFISLSIILTKMTGSLVNPLVITGLGALISVPFLFLVKLFWKQELDLWKILTELRVPFLKILITRGVLGGALVVTGFTMTTAIKSVLLLRLEPVFVFLWTILLHKAKPEPGKMVLLLILLVGSVMVVAPNGAVGGPNLGDALIVASLLFLSYSYIPTKDIVVKANPFGLNILVNISCGIILTLMAYFSGSEQVFVLSAKAWNLLFSYTLVFHIIATSLYFYAFKTLKPWIIASFLSLEVVFGLILAFFMLHESMTGLQLLGAFIVLATTVLIGQLEAGKAKESEIVGI